MTVGRDNLLRTLIDRQYDRNELEFVRGKFRAKGDTVEIYPSNENEKAIRIEFFGDDEKNKHLVKKDIGIIE